MTPSIGDTVDAIVEAIPPDGPRPTRFVIAIAGPPGAGKSTIAAELLSRLGPQRACVLGLDAYHFDNVILDARGHRRRKGAPHTFDVVAFSRMLAVLRWEPDIEISIPRFHRALELSRNCAEVVGPQHRIVIAEGNYLLVDESPWTDLRELFDLTIFLDAPLTVLEERLLERWREHGLTAEAGRAKVDQNDLPNAHYVLQRSRAADVTSGSA